MKTFEENSLELIKESIDLNIDIWEDPDAKHFHNKKTDATCAIKVKNNNLFIVYKYSDNPIDWKYNFKFYPKKVKLGTNKKSLRIHRGHYYQYISLINEVEKYTDNLVVQSEFENIIFTGFSLGGSICQIAAWDFLKTNPSLKDKLHCYSFGASNPGNKEFARQFNEIPNVERVVYNRDPVPILPPRMFGYSRTKNPVLIKKENGEYKFLPENRTLSENTKILSRTVYSKLFNKENKDWKDHNLKKIKNAFKTKE